MSENFRNPSFIRSSDSTPANGRSSVHTQVVDGILKMDQFNNRQAELYKQVQQCLLDVAKSMEIKRAEISSLQMKVSRLEHQLQARESEIADQTERFEAVTQEQDKLHATIGKLLAAMDDRLETQAWDEVLRIVRKTIIVDQAAMPFAPPSTEPPSVKSIVESIPDTSKITKLSAAIINPEPANDAPKAANVTSSIQNDTNQTTINSLPSLGHNSAQAGVEAILNQNNSVPLNLKKIAPPLPTIPEVKSEAVLDSAESDVYALTEIVSAEEYTAETPEQEVPPVTEPQKPRSFSSRFTATTGAILNHKLRSR